MRFTLATAVVFLMSVGAFAQSNQGTITGTISDPAGAVVPNAVIEVKNTETGVISRGGTSATGNYVIAVPAGTYEISVAVPGFKKAVQQNVQVITATDTRKDIALEVGQNTEVVTVEATAPLLKTESGELSHRVTVSDADQLPVLTLSGGSWFGATSMGNIRNPLAISSLLPGVSFSNDNTLVVNGLPSNSETIRVEGQDATGTIWKVLQQNSQGGVDAIQEVAVQTSNFAAEYGQVGGGYFNFTMRSGTNQIHASAYDYLVNEAFNAGLPFTDAGTLTPTKAGQHIRNTQRRNDYGFTVGGPIRIPKVYNGADKSFFFFNFEQYRENRQISNGITSVPTQAYRDGNFATAGCFAYVAATGTCAFTPGLTIGGAPAHDPSNQTLSYGEIFDPNTTSIVNGAQVRLPFPNQQINPTLRFDKVSQAIQALFPLPNAPGIINNYIIPSYTNWQHTTNYSFKLDHSISPTIKLSWYLSRLLTNSPNANGFTQVFATAVPTASTSTTTRLSYDQTIRPTLLLHFGVGYFSTYQPTVPVKFDQTSIGLKGYFQPNLFPTIGGLYNFFGGGWGGPVAFGFPGGSLGGSFEAWIWEQKPTGNASLTWVHGNHTFKLGGEYTGEGYPEHSGWRANGNFMFNQAETSDPWQNGQALNFANGSGFPYASFMLGLPDNLSISPLTQTRLGNHQLGLYLEDSWKVTRRLTLDYGLRYDFQTYLKEQYGRMQDASFTTPNPTVGGLLGAGIYEGHGGGRCNCALSHNYPFAFGPRVGVAYQINAKTVLRAGAGVTYGLVQTPAGASYSTADFYSFNAPGYGSSPVPNGLQGGNPYPNVTWPNFDPGKYPTPTNGLLPPQAPFLFFDPSARPPRILTWSVGLQREVSKDIVVEASYVGNRGVWWAAPALDQISSNSLNDAVLTAHGLSLSSPADRTLLTSLIGSPQAASRGFFPAYPGMPLNQTVAQNIRPVPQWTAPFAWLGPPIGKTWYDALQAKATKRFSHGLQMQAAFTWAKGLENGTGAETGFFVTGLPIINDLWNYGLNKQLNQLVPPFESLFTGSYTTPKTPGDSKGMKVLSQVVRDWQLGFVLRYKSGALIQSPPSNNQLNSQLERGTRTFWNRNPGVNPLSVDPNCGCFNPQTTNVLNSAAWTDAPGGTFGTSAPFYNNYRWQRQPSESMSFGRNFRMGHEGKYDLFIRAEFQNVFNRLLLSMPSVGGFGNVNPATVPSSSGGVNTGGYGYIATVGGVTAVPPRSGQIIARFNF
jgi:hypothetical protein